MLTTMPQDGKIHVNVEMRVNQSPIVWVRFFGFFGCGAGLGWFLRSANSMAKMGAPSVVIALLVMATIGSQLALAIYVYLQRSQEIKNGGGEHACHATAGRGAKIW